MRVYVIPTERSDEGSLTNAQNNLSPYIKQKNASCSLTAKMAEMNNWCWCVMGYIDFSPCGRRPSVRYAQYDKYREKGKKL